jgi:hypothetical protein
MAISDELHKKVAALSRAAPQEWREFLGEFGKYVEGVRGQCITAPLDHLQKAQGHAQQAVAIETLLKNAVSTADRIVERRQT